MLVIRELICLKMFCFFIRTTSKLEKHCTVISFKTENICTSRELNHYYSMFVIDVNYLVCLLVSFVLVFFHSTIGSNSIQSKSIVNMQALMCIERSKQFFSDELQVQLNWIRILCRCDLFCVQSIFLVVFVNSLVTCVVYFSSAWFDSKMLCLY